MVEKLTPNKIRKLLDAVSTDDVRERSQTYFKGGIDAIGVKAANIHVIAKEAANWCMYNGGFAAAVKLTTPLWKKGKLEERLVACGILFRFTDEYNDSSFKMFDDFVCDLKDWASCDYLSADIIGAHLDGKPLRRKALLKWAKSRNLWRRRAAAVSLVKWARKGKYLADVWRVAALLMPDKEDMVRKGVGWLLRETARTEPEKVVVFCQKHEDKASRLILRTAAETMPEKWRVKLLGVSKRKSGKAKK